MRHGNRTAQDLVPPGCDGLNLAHYRTLLPLYNAEQDTFSPWAAFLPDGPDGLEQLRTMDLYDLRQAAVDAGKHMAGWDSPRGRVSEEFTATLVEALGEFISRGCQLDSAPVAGSPTRSAAGHPGDLREPQV